MNDEVKDKGMTPEEWEADVKARLNEVIDNMLSIAKDCNMGTRYMYPIVDQFETHTDYDYNKINGAELRIVFNFVEAIDKDKFNFV